LAGGAEPPENDFGLVHEEPVAIRRLQAGCRTDGAINIDRRGALAADQVMMVVPDPGFVQGRASPGLDSADKAGRDQHVQIVEHCLP
jgi:hypothetical protein